MPGFCSRGMCLGQHHVRKHEGTVYRDMLQRQVQQRNHTQYIRRKHVQGVADMHDRNAYTHKKMSQGHALGLGCSDMSRSVNI